MSLDVNIRNLFKRWQEGLCPGGQVYVAHKGEVIFAEHYGYADIERHIPVTEATVFHVASVSKQVTCMCVLLLAERGLIDIDADVRKYLPDLVNFEETVTIRDLMNNISGIRDQWELQQYAGVRMNDIITQRDLLTTTARQKSLNFPPRSKYLYSNSNFTYLAELVERISGKTFNQFAKENIFEPLGMENTFARERYDDLVPNRALSYVDCGEGRFLWKSLNFSNYGATSLHTTGKDFLKWLRNYRELTIMKKETLDIMTTVPELTTDEKTDYACGVMMNRYNGYDFKGVKIISHTGADAGYRSAVLSIPEEELEVAIFSNTENLLLEGVAFNVAALVLGATKVELNKENALYETETRLIEIGFSGNYLAADLGSMLKISQQEGKVIVFLGDKKETFIHCCGNRYINNTSGNSLYVTADAVYLSMGNTTNYKLEEPKLAQFIVTEKDDLVGLYYNDEVEEFYEIIQDNGEVLLRHKRFGQASIYELEEGLYLCPLDRAIKFKLSRNNQDKFIALAFQGGRITEILFRKVALVYSE